MPNALPPLLRDQREIDAGHIKLLAIFHFVAAGLSFLKLLFLGLHFIFFSFMFAEPELWGPAPPGPPPKQLLALFSIFYVIFGVYFLTILVLEAVSGYFLWRRKHRMFSMIAAGINCINVPLGTALGVFTLIVLMRGTVCQLYEASSGGE